MGLGQVNSSAKRVGMRASTCTCLQRKRWNMIETRQRRKWVDVLFGVWPSMMSLPSFVFYVRHLVGDEAEVVKDHSNEEVEHDVLTQNFENHPHEECNHL